MGEDDLVPLSALQHLVFCERQCALIHVEQAWADNRLTVEGSHQHARVDEEGRRFELRGDVLICRGLPVRSFRLGLSGRTDVVEFHRLDGSERTQGVALQGRHGRWQPFPIEHKHGKPKIDDCDEVQLCAQAICVEEMLDTVVSEGALFYGKTHRRHGVTFTPELRSHTERAAARLHELLASGVTPAAVKTKKCDACSLLPRCLPSPVEPARSAAEFTRRQLRRILADDGLGEER
ncbi:MAG: CRISPR-associated protein Cas4 [Acidobacteria bacterium]|nr:CRISPR-associated protein Cas4 [Acidobacteriota bacterium]